MKIISAAAQLLQLLIIESCKCEEVMDIEQLKEAVLHDTKYSRKERERFQERLLHALEFGSMTDTGVNVIVSEITGKSYLVSPEIMKVLSSLNSPISSIFTNATCPLPSTINMERFLELFQKNDTPPESVRSPEQLRYHRRNRLTQKNIEQLTEEVLNMINSGYTNKRFPISEIMKKCNIHESLYTAVVYHVNILKKNHIRGGSVESTTV